MSRILPGVFLRSSVLRPGVSRESRPAINDFIPLREKVTPIAFPSKSSDYVSAALAGASDISLTSLCTWESPSHQSRGSLRAPVTGTLCHCSARVSGALKLARVFLSVLTCNLDRRKHFLATSLFYDSITQCFPNFSLFSSDPESPVRSLLCLAFFLFFFFLLK